ncbi:hypothetical protein MKZ38_009566 [Zalerion maritima]|uniref:Uncharacterized protein n=1 Tax=Zalerion maritima TaxID=339359 RepID=A0AAD5WTF0_9PEZI|nr:hypothetical protein MKZ38_009566 [Zalerion maritima]
MSSSTNQDNSDGDRPTSPTVRVTPAVLPDVQEEHNDSVEPFPAVNDEGLTVPEHAVASSSSVNLPPTGSDGGNTPYGSGAGPSQHGLPSIQSTAGFQPRNRRPSRPPVHVHYALNIQTQGVGGEPELIQSAAPTSPPMSSHSHAPSNDMSSPPQPRLTRTATFTPVANYDGFKVKDRSGWKPGAEPGLDPSLPDGGRDDEVPLHAECEIQVIDFSHESLVMHHLNNRTIKPFLRKPTPKWVLCRWINVNGISWDVIQALGQAKKLHKLSLEDVVDTKTRTKVDWYSNHAFMAMTLQKLVHIVEDSSSSESDLDTEIDSDDEKEMDDSDTQVPVANEKPEDYQGPEDGHSIHSTKSKMSTRSIKGIKRQMTRMFGIDKMSNNGGRNKSRKSTNSSHLFVGKSASHRDATPTSVMYRTLHNYHASPNAARNRFMEKHSALSVRNFAISAEQVSLFVTSDNTLISFFEVSALDLQRPIIERLSSPDTILRRSCDASMVAQAIIDATIDLAMPVAALYSDVIGDLELDILTKPDMKHTKMLYIMTTEITKVRQLITPVSNLITTLREHQTRLSAEEANRYLRVPEKGVIITPQTSVYLSDVFDHCSMINDQLGQAERSAAGLIDLIFNTIAATQNDTMKILTNVTIAFLPLTFITGYFGQNFDPFPDIALGIGYFWKVAIPTAVATILVLMFPMIKDYLLSLKDRAKIRRSRAKRRKRDERRRNKYLGPQYPNRRATHQETVL